MAWCPICNKRLLYLATSSLCFLYYYHTILLLFLEFLVSKFSTNSSHVSCSIQNWTWRRVLVRKGKYCQGMIAGSDGSERNFRSAFRNSFRKFRNETELRSEFWPKLNENPELVPKLMERNEPRSEKFGTGPITALYLMLYLCPKEPWQNR